MHVNSLKYNKRCCLSITFPNEIEERIFLQKILNRFEKILPVNCMLTDLDTSYSAYEEYFGRNNYYVFDRLTTASIFAFDLTSTEIQEVISNWGYFTIYALFAIGPVPNEIKKQKSDCIEILKSLPIVIEQVPDLSIDITMDKYYFEDIFQFVIKNDS